MPEKVTAADAQLILQLYDLRRETEMRKARSWFMTEFWPENADDFIKVAFAMGSPENAWLRQVSSYWGMVASLVLQGAISSELFLQPAISGEMFFLLAKVQPFLKELREKMGDQELLANVEKLATSSEYGRKRLEMTLKRVEMLRERMAATVR
ncbi:MAG TPA: hypothetical protein VMX38_18045 [Verrucomicrobiae bacterium]|jgi:hypothetical protein|nr:hypothetical protein [Verrucomicrobiae bacterium]